MLINSDALSSRRVNKADLYDLSYSSLQSANLIPKSNPAGRPIFRAKLARPRTHLARHHHRPTQNTALLKGWVAAAGFQRAWAMPQISPWQSLTRFPLRLNFSPRLYRPTLSYAAGPPALVAAVASARLPPLAAQAVFAILIFR